MNRQTKALEMQDRTPWAKLAKYLAGECSPEEEKEIEEWVEANPSRKRLAEQVRLIWDAAGDSEAEESEDWLDVDTEWEKLQAEIDASSGSTSGQQSVRQQSVKRQFEPERSEQFSKRAADYQSLLSVGMPLAAVALTIIAATFLWYSPSLTSDQSPVERKVTTERGERATLRLSDGTKVRLNAESQLRFPDSFHEQDRRIVHLSGEAYFDVEDDSTRRFTVRTSGASIDVHGTAFNVRARSGREEIQVAVEEGGVSLRTPEADSNGRKKVRLRSGEVGRVLGKSTLITTDQANLKTYVGWTDGLLVFENASLPEVTARLGRWYNLDFVIQNSSLRSMRLTADLKSESPKEVLNVIAATLGIQYQVDQGTVYLSSRGNDGDG
ncbi:ferric-dicitrate binding protein FerR (iron transport regulator) [Salinibacter ruber]|uniref:FecR family protein n=1 Tax=Salinibacter ruber TaxID=146919 RepID=UPI00216A17D6|nr:FecR domain-containing protein [Salinibacter ruber]MCS3708133.1 ferric-dicitrate binding protein FerR (iron transport regulator) [Salinibacter ruber]MCS3854695.1 ferric-dicitrate binding protein FerR (iron transport regulator) [Salinibacter ruber]MCS4116093.1 ferric-dicitrate binding protein FerR (iron transport regulator) [Salinibacter ruber]MCS4181471.1 ferric-dicitrate binding protein FerR (iron transport regulator) [Salinibacter ruber]